MPTQPIVLIKVPFFWGQKRFKISKAQPWGPVDHLLLQTLAKQSYSAQQLADLSNLPRRLIIEIMIPFIRIGWVELVIIEQQYTFAITPTGVGFASSIVLPTPKEELISSRQFIIDITTGKCHRVGGKQSNFKVYSASQVKERLESRVDLSMELSIPKPHASPSLADIFDCVSERDEDVYDYIPDPTEKSIKIITKYAIVEVNELNEINGLPSDISEDLNTEILKAAKYKIEIISLLGTSSSSNKKIEKYSGTSYSQKYEIHLMRTDEYELILGGVNHLNHLEMMIREAKTRLIIHSTFIDPKRLNDLFPALIDAAKRSVQIDILWGQSEPEKVKDIQSYQNTIQEIETFNQKIRNEGLNSSFTIHRDPTESHIKFIIADLVQGEYSATIGSCNWLASGFYRFEASVCMKQPNIVREIMVIASKLASGKTKISNNLSREIAVLANQYRNKVTLQRESNEQLAKARLILKTHHNEYLRVARDEANNDIFLCSHRISKVIDRPILTPLKAATKAHNNISAMVYYGAPSGGITQREVNELSESLQRNNIKLAKTSKPSVHAKVLTWDNNKAVITSLHWLSASATGDDYEELGIYIEDDGIALSIKDAFYLSQRLEFDKYFE